MKGCKIIGSAGNGVAVGADRSVIQGNTISDVAAGSYAINVQAGVVDCIIGGNILDEDATGVITFADGTERAAALDSNMARNVQLLHKYSTFVSHTGSVALTTMRTITIPGGRMDASHGFNIRVMGNVPAASTNGNKDITVTFGGVTIGLVQFLPAETGFFALDILLMNRTGSDQNCMVTVTKNGTVTGQEKATVVNTAVDQDIDVDFQLADINDTINLRIVLVESLPS